MMRRIVDATIPACGAIATIPVFARIVDLPMALERSIGEASGILWCVIVGAAMITIVAGILFRRARPSLAFKLEFPALIIAGTISTIYGVTIIGFIGFGRGWTPTWFVWAIGFHCLARYIELSYARRQLRKAEAAAIRAALQATK